MSKIQTFIFIGRSGSGKGTQAKHLINYLESNTESPVLYVETGRYFRELLNQPTHTANLARAVSERGDLQPSFLASYLWSHLLIDNFTGIEHLVFDGTPRTLNEAQALDTALKFYKRERPKVILLNVDTECATSRLLARRRPDDSEEGVKKRLAWYESDVLPAVEYYRAHSGYQFIEISGDRSIEEIHDKIKAACD